MSSPAPATAAAILGRSRAFRLASLRSEERRAYAVIVVLLLVVVPVTLVTSAKPLDAYFKIIGVLAGLALLAVQLTSIALAYWGRKQDRAVPTWFGFVGVAIECSVPTGAIVAHIKLGTLAPYTALSSPPLLAYGLLIALTTLKLRPALSLWAGTIAATGYAALLVYVSMGLELPVPAEGWPRYGYLMAMILIFASGVAAAWVAGEIRAYVQAALDEADARGRIDRIEQDLSTARSIQRALLPSTAPTIPGFDIAAWNRPADQTGGDYYDWQALPDGRWIVTLADVSGHGIGPALVTAACRAYVRASSTHMRDLASLAARINRLLAEDLPDGRFVTMATVMLDEQGGPLALLSAGHGPIVLYVSASGEMRDIMPDGMPLAVAADADFGPAQLLEMKPGDVLALVTDGFVEWARNSNASEPREEFGVERLRKSLASHAHRSSAEIIRAIASDVAVFAGEQPQQDDLTMVIIRRTEHPNEQPLK